MANVNPMQVHKLLSGMDYPAGRDQIVGHAKLVGADTTVISLLNKLPNDSYQTPIQISRAIGNLD
jgi:hypothetical protein